MGDFWQNATVHPEDTGVAYLRRTITPSTPGYPTVASAATVIPIGALPSGAMPIGLDCDVETVFNSTTTLVDVGVVGTVAGYAAAAATLAQAAGFKPNLQSTLSGIPVAVDTIVNASITFTGSAPTTGKIHLLLKYAPKRSVSGALWPAN